MNSLKLLWQNFYRQHSPHVMQPTTFIPCWHSYSLRLPYCLQWDNVSITHRCSLHDQTNDSVGHTTDCRPAWNKCRLNHCRDSGVEYSFSTPDSCLAYTNVLNRRAIDKRDMIYMIWYDMVHDFHWKTGMWLTYNTVPTYCAAVHL